MIRTEETLSQVIRDAKLNQGPLYPVAKLNHEKIFGHFTRHEKLSKRFHVHAKIKAIPV